MPIWIVHSHGLRDFTVICHSAREAQRVAKELHNAGFTASTWIEEIGDEPDAKTSEKENKE